MIKKIGVIGAGTAGLITALILKARFESIQINIIKSDKIGIIGVGEGTTEHWKDFAEFVGISAKDLILKAGATYKYGIMFEDWTDHSYFHNVIKEVHNIRLGQYQAGYSYSIVNNLKPKEYSFHFCWDNKIATNALANQLHFDTFKLNDFLLEKCKQKNINIIEDGILKVDIKNNQIQSLNNKYFYDFYIDSTGFKKVLISQLGAKWISYQEHLPLNEAIAFPTPDTKEYTPYTLAKAMSSGWLWRIPTQGRWGNGYVFNNNYINATQAQRECENYLGFKIKVGKNITFNAGALDRAWIGNCVAVGLSSSFIEPLEASSIGTTIQQAFILIHKIINYRQADIDSYNLSFKTIVENIRDFVLLHYIINKKDSLFWKELKLNLPKSLVENLQKWKFRIPMESDFPEKYCLFKEANFVILLKELNLFDKNTIVSEFNTLSNHLKNSTEFKMRKLWKTKFNIIDHKKYLKDVV